MIKKRVHELAKELGIESKDMIVRLKALGYDVKSHNSTLEDDCVRRVMAAQKPSAPGFIRRPKRDVVPAPTVQPTPVSLANQPAQAPTITPPAQVAFDIETHAPVTPVERPTPNHAVVVSRPDHPVTIYGPRFRTEPGSSGARRPAVPSIRQGGNRPSPSIVSGGLASTAPKRPAPVFSGRPAPESTDRRDAERPKGKRTTGSEQPTSKNDLLDIARGRIVIPVVGRKKRPTRRGQQTVVTEMSVSKKVLEVESSITIRELSERLGLKIPAIIRQLMSVRPGMIPTANSPVDHETAGLIAIEHGWTVTKPSVEVGDFVVPVSGATLSKQPVIVVAGHVDHGKTTLLDCIRVQDVASGEAGGITQGVAAYMVTLPGRGEITFLDTPGHEAFQNLRKRGLQAADIMLLVVAADDGIQPQTIEAIETARSLKLAVVVAVNKMDRPGANLDTVKGALSNAGIQPEDWGGDTPVIGISARNKQGIDQLLDACWLQADLLDRKFDPSRPARGIVLEVGSSRGHGTVSTVIVQDGTLRDGDIVVAGRSWRKIHLQADIRAGQSGTVSGLSAQTGDPFDVVPDEAAAHKIVDHRMRSADLESGTSTARLTIADLAAQRATNAPEELLLILKADRQGSVEACRAAILALSCPKVTAKIVHAGTGDVTEGDVGIARASKAVIVGFNVKAESRARQIAKVNGIQISEHDVIYALLDAVRDSMESCLEPIKRERRLGQADVQQVFGSSKKQLAVAGCRVADGLAVRGALVRVARQQTVIYTGKVVSLRRFKDDVHEVPHGVECGITVDGFSAFLPGDRLEMFDIETIRQQLS